jgi:hypothetical protein
LRVEILNKLVATIWGDEAILVVPIVVTRNEVGDRQANGGLTPILAPIPGLNVRTQQITVDEDDAIGKIVGKVKSDYKYLSPHHCIESGCELVLSSILGNLITKPTKSAILNHSKKEKKREGGGERGHRDSDDSHDREKNDCRRPTSRHGGHVRRSRSTGSSKYHVSERKLHTRDNFNEHMTGGFWSKVKCALMDL